MPSTHNWQVNPFPVHNKDCSGKTLHNANHYFQVPGRTRYNKCVVVDIDGEVMEGRGLPWREGAARSGPDGPAGGVSTSTAKVATGQTHRDPCCHLGFRPLKHSACSLNSERCSPDVIGPRPRNERTSEPFGEHAESLRVSGQESNCHP